ncbi:MAG: hypothetical protein KKG43_05755, partial [Candidatus Omnitrophica bacterium]|nr:hypothetical protein [Candidatus Omnitrophota bacterium]
MNIYTISSISICLTSLVLGIITIFKGRNKEISYLWTIICILLFIWGFGGYRFSTTASENTALIWWRVAHITVIFMPILFYHFVYAFLKLNKKYQKLLLYALYIIGFFLLILTFLPSRNIFLGQIRLYFTHDRYFIHYWPENRNILYLLFYIFFYWILLIYAFLILINAYKNSKGILRNQLKYFIVGSLIAWIGPHGDYLPVFGINIYPYSNFLIGIYPLIFVYAILKYRLMDITIAFTRASIFLVTYTLILGIPFAVATIFKERLITIFGGNWWISPLVLMGLLATIGPFIYIYLNRKAEEALLREQKRYQNTLKQASIGMTRIRNLKRLLELIAHIVTKTV